MGAGKGSLDTLGHSFGTSGQSVIFSVFYGGLAGPALKGTVKCALFRKARLKGNFAHRLVGMAQQIQGYFLLDGLHQSPKSEALFGQPSFEGAGAHTEVFRNLLDAGNTTWKILFDKLVYLTQ